MNLHNCVLNYFVWFRNEKEFEHSRCGINYQDIIAIPSRYCYHRQAIVQNSIIIKYYANYVIVVLEFVSCLSPPTIAII
jgi:hypothetical protein